MLFSKKQKGNRTQELKKRFIKNLRRRRLKRFLVKASRIENSFYSYIKLNYKSIVSIAAVIFAFFVIPTIASTMDYETEKELVTTHAEEVDRLHAGATLAIKPVSVEEAEDNPLIAGSTEALIQSIPSKEELEEIEEADREEIEQEKAEVEKAEQIAAKEKAKESKKSKAEKALEEKRKAHSYEEWEVTYLADLIDKEVGAFLLGYKEVGYWEAVEACFYTGGVVRNWRDRKDGTIYAAINSPGRYADTTHERMGNGDFCKKDVEMKIARALLEYNEKEVIKEILGDSADIEIPETLVYQAEFKQGRVYRVIGNEYFGVLE